MPNPDRVPDADAPPLTGIRVTDVTTTLGELAGRLLADLGAEVIKVEPPGGCAARHMPPFDERPESAGGVPSLYWAATGLGKRSVVLDLEDRADRDQLLRLIDRSDVFIESFAPGHIASLGLGFAELAERNPRLVYASVSPFGQDGPKAHHPATDLTLEAAGGRLSMQGEGDRPPIPVGYPQASFHAAAQAAADIVVALRERMNSGLGQHLDVSAQAAMVWTLLSATGYPPNHGSDPPGMGANRGAAREVAPGFSAPASLECADGWVSYGVFLPRLGPITHEAVIRWAIEEGEPGLVPAEVADRSWLDYIAELQEGELSPEVLRASFDAVAAFARTKTKQEFQEYANEHSLLVSPFWTIDDLIEDRQLAARDYWRRVGERLHPGPFIRMSGTPIGPGEPAPELGEHQSLADTGEEEDQERPPENLSSPAAAEGEPAGSTPDGRRPGAFEGLRVADFSWVGVGPIIAKALADQGATVVRVESATRPDILRLLPPFAGTEPGLNRSQFQANFNSSKLGLALDLASEEGRRVARRLTDWADVVVESFTPGNMKRFGLDYEALASERPELIMLSSCLRGQTGPEARYTGFGSQGACLTGFQAITGWPGRPPIGPAGAYTDLINPRYGVAALTAAIMHRERTGVGQHLDLSQTEAAIRFLEPLVLDYTVNGRVAAAAGHDSLTAAPHGVYPANGHERWVAIAVETKDQWRALVAVLGLDEFSGERFDSIETRREHADAIDAAISNWCEPQDAFEIEAKLAAAGVPASVSLWPMDLYEDPQLAHRGFFVTLEHTEMGPTPYDGPATQFSATPTTLWKAGPCVGEDTEYVLSELLGLSGEEISELAAAGALT